MGEIISDQELRRRLSVFNKSVPPVTATTRKLLLKQLAKLEGSQGSNTNNAASKIMPPPKSKVSVSNESIMISSSLDTGKQSQHIKFENSPRKSARRQTQHRARDVYDTSDSEVDTGTLGYSILPANPKIASSSPKSNETSLMNVSSWKNTDEDQNSYLISDTKKTLTDTNRQLDVRKEGPVPSQFIYSKPTKTITESVTRKLRSSPSATDSKSHADQAILRWKEKLLNQSKDENDANITSQRTLFNSPSPILISSQTSRRNFQTAQQRFLGNKNTKNIQNILISVGFLVAIFGLYFISIQNSKVELPQGILNSLCAKKNLEGSVCDTEQIKIQNLYNSLVSQVQDRYIKNQCDNPDLEPTMDAHIVFEYISTHENIPPREIDELIELFISIAKTFSDSPIGFDTKFRIKTQPNLPVTCAIKQIFSNMFYLLTWLGIVALSVVGLYFVICYITTKNEKIKQEIHRLIEDTIELLKEQTKNHPNESYLAIIHIRDRLIPFNERQEKSKIWAEVERYFTESESSVRSEVQEIDGEDFQVWRWVQPMSPGM